MPKNTNEKRGAIICGVVVIALLVLCLGGVIAAVLWDMSAGFEIAWVLLIHGSIIAAVLIGVLLALRQRLKEIDKGEEEDAKKY